MSRLTLEETQKEREEKHTEYEELRKSFLSKCEVPPQHSRTFFCYFWQQYAIALCLPVAQMNFETSLN